MRKMVYKIKVQWSDTDAAGIVFFGNFYKWMDAAAHHFFNQIGLNPETLYEKEKITYPLLEAQCQFKSPLRFGDEVTVVSSVVEASRRAFKMTHDFYKKDKLVASGYTWRAWTDFSGTEPKAVPIPDEVKEAFGLPGKDAPVATESR